MDKKEKILQIIKNNKIVKTKEISEETGATRQYINQIITELIDKGDLIKIGSTLKAFYVTPEYMSDHADEIPAIFKIRLKNERLEEHVVLENINNEMPSILNLKENIRSIFEFAFLEMLNNAIEHSISNFIEIEVKIHSKKLFFTVDDFGIGVFRNIMKKRKLKSELEAIQDLLKGKTTTKPKMHTGEGIFFTSKVGEKFSLDSYGFQLVIDNKVGDIFLGKPDSTKRGTKVEFNISLDSNLHLNDVFKKYTNIDDESDYGFDKTEVKIKLYTIGGVYISRSQARRVLAGLDKFKSIIFDFEKVSMVGQAFADEIFRIFKNKHPDIKIQPTNMNDAVEFMIKRAGADDGKSSV